MAAEWPAPPILITALAASIPRSADDTVTTPSTGESFSRQNGSSGTTSSAGASSSLVRGGTLIPAWLAIQAASLPIAAPFSMPSGNRYARSRPTPASSSSTAPCRCISRMS